MNKHAPSVSLHCDALKHCYNIATIMNCYSQFMMVAMEFDLFLFGKYNPHKQILSTQLQCVTQ